jgi:hypothetical protein
MFVSTEDEFASVRARDYTFFDAGSNWTGICLLNEKRKSLRSKRRT